MLLRTGKNSKGIVLPDFGTKNYYPQKYQQINKKLSTKAQKYQNNALAVSRETQNRLKNLGESFT